MTLNITGDAAADRLLTEDPLALLIGMLLDQQVPMETAFAGPLKIAERAGTLDAAALAHTNPDEFAALEQDWGGDAAALWTEGAPDGAEVLRRLKKLPGFGEQKAKIFLALLGKQYGYAGAGWREASAPYGEDGSHRSVADIVSPESLAKVREFKRAQKAAAKTRTP
jgi:hypothetical protein